MNVVDIEDIDKLEDNNVKVKNLEKLVVEIKRLFLLKASIVPYPGQRSQYQELDSSLHHQ